jgi:hypothetical protein
MQSVVETFNIIKAEAECDDITAAILTVADAVEWSAEDKRFESLANEIGMAVKNALNTSILRVENIKEP